jgi:hypothetical protein
VAGQEETTAHGDQAAADRDANGRAGPAPTMADELPLLGSLLARVDALPGDVACQQRVHRVLLVIEPVIEPVER